MRKRAECDGTVRGLQDHRVLLTGTTHVHGRHVKKDELRRMIRQRGGSNAPDRSRTVTLLVIGDLRGQVVVDPVNVRSQKVEFVDDQRRDGNHICVVDEEGFSALLDGDTAPCLETRPVETGKDVVEVSRPFAGTSEAGPASMLGGPLLPREPSVHQEVRLEIDLNALDYATGAHEQVVRQLAHLAQASGVTVESAGPGMPLFDAGWVSPEDDGVLMIAEVKSLTGTVETQQIRLGLGQVLDYAHGLRSGEHGTVLKVVPVLVLQREPAETRWSSLAESLGVVITWAPDFPGLLDRQSG